MPTRIQKIGQINGIKPNGKTLNLSELIQESYKLSYEAKKLKNDKLTKLTESHIKHVTDNPTKTKVLSEDLEVLQKLVNLSKKKSIKLSENISKEKSLEGPVTRNATKIKESSWKNSKKTLSKSLKEFREISKSKVFYKELSKFNSNISKGTPITINEAIDLYKATNSCLTHLTVELGKKPEFIKAYRECTKLLSKDNMKLLESIQDNKVPTKELLENFVTFTNILLESNAPEDLDPEIYEKCNEDDDMLALDNKDVIDTEEDSETSVDENEDVTVDLTSEELNILKSILNKITPMKEDIDPETVPDEEIVPEVDDDETEDIDYEEDPTDDYVEDEELEEEDTEITDEFSKEDPEEEEFVTNSEDLDEEDGEEDCETCKDTLTRLKELQEEVSNLIDAMSSEETPDEDEEETYEEDDEDLEENCVDCEDNEEEIQENEEENCVDCEDDTEINEEDNEDYTEENLEENCDEEDCNDFDVEITESSKARIKKCFR